MEGRTPASTDSGECINNNLFVGCVIPRTSAGSLTNSEVGG